MAGVWRRVLLGTLAAVGLVAVGWAAGPAWAVGGHVRDRWAIVAVAVAAALDWRDFGRDRALQRLQFGLDRARVAVVRDEDCELVASTGIREVRCAWSVAVHVPFVDRPWVIDFSARAAIDRQGALRR